VFEELGVPDEQCIEGILCLEYPREKLHMIYIYSDRPNNRLASRFPHMLMYRRC
jgi:hypothetical protein